MLKRKLNGKSYTKRMNFFEEEEEDENNLKEKNFLLGSQYKALEILGSGTYGTVYKVLDKTTKNFYAIKNLKIDSEKDGVPVSALREISILKNLSHPNIIKVIGAIYKKKGIEMCLEFCKSDLVKFMRKNRDNPEIYNQKFIKNMMYQLFKGVNYLHRRGVLHRDLKPLNLLIREDKMTLKIADFGLSRVILGNIRPFTQGIMTLYYIPPEIVLGINSYGTEIDIWSIGCVFAEMFLLQPLFMANSQIDLLYKIMQIFGTFNNEKLLGYCDFPNFEPKFPFFKGIGLKEYITKNAKIKPDKLALDLMQKLLEVNPLKRITTKDALAHPYFYNVECTCSYSGDNK